MFFRAQYCWDVVKDDNKNVLGGQSYIQKHFEATRDSIEGNCLHFLFSID